MLNPTGPFVAWTTRQHPSIIAAGTRLRNCVVRQPGLVAALTLPSALLLLGFLTAHHRWEARAAVLESENTQLQLQDFSKAMLLESEELHEAAREFVATADLADLLPDPAPATLTRPSPEDLLNSRIDSVLVATTAGAIRFSAQLDRGELKEDRPDPALLRFLDRAGATSPGPGDANFHATLLTGFARGQLLVAQPIMSRTALPVLMGWTVAGRRLSPALVKHLAQADAAPAGGSARLIDAATVPRSLRGMLEPGAGGGVTLVTGVASEDGAGYAVLYDDAGRVAGVFELEGSAAGRAFGKAQPESTAGLPPAVILLVALLGAAAATLGVLVLKRFLQHRRSVDSRYKAIIDQTNDAIVIVDAATHRVQYTNPAFLTRLGYTSAEASTLTLTDIFADGTTPPESVLSRLRSADSQMALSLQQRCKNGLLLDIEVRCNALDVEGRDSLAYVTHDVSVRRKAEAQLIDNQQRLDRMAHHDQLTGLPNRHYLATHLPAAIAQAGAAGALLGVVFLDLDRFKHINDTRGHETGDKLLQEVARRLKACVRDADIVIRMGGDEFVVVFRNVKAFEEVTQGAARIIATLNTPIMIDGHPLQTTGSVGVSVYPRDGTDLGELLKHSDTAMYQAKDRGRNNVQMFNPLMNRKLKHRVSMEASLREALRLKQFDVHYQPFVNLLTRKIVGLEALIRWRHPVQGMIPADQFIPVAEETGLIVPMGNFVLHRTLQTLSAWQKAGHALVPISLNVAPAQLQRGELQSTISTLLKTHGLRPELLQLEMTERAVFDSTQTRSGDDRQDSMARLRDLGIKIAIDDFGTGYSSLSYLKNWRVDALKIDRSFVRDLVTDSSDLAIVSAIIAIARHLQIQVIAEGIEGYQQAEILRKLGCAIGQGFLFARPMPADECVKLLSKSGGELPDEEDMLAAFAAGCA